MNTAACRASVVRRIGSEAGHFFGFKIDEADDAWRRCVAALESGHTASDLDHA